jgi:hypothetical protein
MDIIKLNCFDSIVTNEKIKQAKLVKGDTFKAFCPGI